MTVTCKNCDQLFEGNFCPNCGQKAATHSINHKFISHEVPHALFHVDKGIFYTIRELTIRPGSTYLDYIQGKRIKHFSPIAYILILSSIYLLIRNFVWHSYLHVPMPEAHELSQKIRQFQYIGFIFLGATPVFAFFSWLFFSKGSRLNYWEFLVGHTYFLGHTIFILLIFMALRIPFPASIESAIFAIAESCIVFVYLVLCSYQLLAIFYTNKVLLMAKVIASLLLSAMASFLILANLVALLERFN